METEEITEIVVDEIPSRISYMLQQPWVKPAAVGAVAFAGGVGIGYIWAKRRYTKFYDEPETDQEDPNQLSLFDHSSENLRELLDELEEYERQADELECALIEYTPELEQEAEDIVAEIEIEDALLEISDDKDGIRNVFAGTKGSWNLERELSTRTSNAPYVIHLDEFVLDDMGYEQTTVVYYSGDDILALQDDTPMYDYESFLGELKFGHGSNDPSIVYIRNEDLEEEWEVMLHQGRYEVEVLGHTIEAEYERKAQLKHSQTRFRDE